MPDPMTDKVAVTQEVESLRARVARWGANPSKGSRVTVPLGELRAVLETLDTTRIATAEACAIPPEHLASIERAIRLADNLSGDVPITAAARAHITHAYNALAAIRLQQGSEKP